MTPLKWILIGVADAAVVGFLAWALWSFNK